MKLMNHAGCWAAFALTFPFGAEGRGQTAGPPALVWVAPGHDGLERSIAFSASGELLATSCRDDATIKLWRVADGSLLRTIGGTISMMEKIIFTPDGEYLIGGSDWVPGSPDEQYKLWRVADGSFVRSFGDDSASGVATLGTMALSADGGTLATGYNYDKTRLWRYSDGALIRTLAGAGDPIGFTPDGALLLTHQGSLIFSSGIVQVWRTSDWSLLRTIDVASAGPRVNCAAISPDGSSVAVGFNNAEQSAKILRIADGALLRTLVTAPEYSVYDLTFSPAGSEIVLAGQESVPSSVTSRMFVFRAGDGVLLRTIPGNYSGTDAVVYSSDGARLACGGADSFVHLFDAPTGQPIRNFGIRRGLVGAVAFSADSSLVAAGGYQNETLTGGDVELFRAADGRRLRVCHGHVDLINAVAFAGDGQVIASGSGAPPPDTRDPSVRLWRVEDASVVWVAPGHAGGTTSVTFARGDQVVVSGGRDRLVKVWNRADRTLLASLSGHTGAVIDLALSPDGSLLASAGDTTIRLRRTSDWSLVRVIPNDWGVNSISFSPDGQRLAVGLDSYGNNLRIVRVSDGSLIREFTGDPFDFLTQATFTADGSFVLTSSRGYPPRIWVWNAGTGSLAQFFEQETGWRYAPKLAVAPNGRHVAVGRADATVEVARRPFRVAPASN